MASNKRAVWVGNLSGLKGPLVRKGLFQAGSTQAVCAGEILELNSSGYFVPISADSLRFGTLAIANEEIKAGYREGYYEIIEIRPDDIFEFELSTAAAIVEGTPVGYSTSQKVSSSASYAFGRAVGEEHYPELQGHLGDDISGDAGTTVRSTSYARIVFLAFTTHLFAITTPQHAFVLPVVCTAAGAEDETVVASAPFKFQILDAWMVAKDTNAANVTIKNGSNAITDTVAKGGTDDAIVRFAKLIYEYSSVAKGGSVVATFSAQGSVLVNLLCIPVI